MYPGVAEGSALNMSAGEEAGLQCPLAGSRDPPRPSLNPIPLAALLQTQAALLMGEATAVQFVKCSQFPSPLTTRLFH